VGAAFEKEVEDLCGGGKIQIFDFLTSWQKVGAAFEKEVEDLSVAASPIFGC